jgi:hypothetical protein
LRLGWVDGATATEVATALPWQVAEAVPRFLMCGCGSSRGLFARCDCGRSHCCAGGAAKGARLSKAAESTCESPDPYTRTRVRAMSPLGPDASLRRRAAPSAPAAVPGGGEEGIRLVFPLSNSFTHGTRPWGSGRAGPSHVRQECSAYKCGAWLACLCAAAQPCCTCRDEAAATAASAERRGHRHQRGALALHVGLNSTPASRARLSTSPPLTINE